MDAADDLIIQIDPMEEKIAKHWGLLSKIKEEKEIFPNVYEIVTSSGCLILKIKNDEENARNALSLLWAINSIDVPIEKPIRTIKGHLFVAQDKKLYSLFNRIPGRSY